MAAAAARTTSTKSTSKTPTRTGPPNAVPSKPRWKQVLSSIASSISPRKADPQPTVEDSPLSENLRKRRRRRGFSPKSSGDVPVPRATVTSSSSSEVSSSTNPVNADQEISASIQIAATGASPSHCKNAEAADEFSLMAEDPALMPIPQVAEASMTPSEVTVTYPNGAKLADTSRSERNTLSPSPKFHLSSHASPVLSLNSAGKRRRSLRPQHPTKRLLDSIAQEDDDAVAAKSNKPSSSPESFSRKQTRESRTSRSKRSSRMPKSTTQQHVTPFAKRPTNKKRRRRSDRFDSSSLSAMIEKLESLSLGCLHRGSPTLVLLSENPWHDDSAWDDMAVKPVTSESPPTGRPAKRSRASLTTTVLDPPKAEAYLKERATASKALSAVSVPVERSPQYLIWNRLQKHEFPFRIARSNSAGIPCTKIRMSPNTTTAEKALSRCIVALDYVRVRISAGMVRSAIKLLHEMLTEGYSEAKKLLGNKRLATAYKGDLEDDEENMYLLFALRERLAGLWCIYAHSLIEIGDLALQQDAVQGSQQQVQGYNGGTGGDTMEAGNPWSSICDHVESVLYAARSCPLVGNHSSVVLSLGRFLVSGLALRKHAQTASTNGFQETSGVDDASVSSLVLLDSVVTQSAISSAIRNCWDGIDGCRKETASSGVAKIGDPEVIALCIDQLNMFNPRVGKEPRISLEELQRGLSKTLFLPEDLERRCRQKTPKAQRKAGPSVIPFVFMDRNSIRDLCVELNRWSRLGEQIERRRQQLNHWVLRPGESLFATTNILDDLPLFRCVQLVRRDHVSSKTVAASPSKGGHRPSTFDAGSACHNIEYACKRCYACFSTTSEMDFHELRADCCSRRSSLLGREMPPKNSELQCDEAPALQWKWS